MSERDFDQDTALRRIGDGRFEADVADRRWWVVRGPNGGFVAGMVLWGVPLVLFAVVLLVPLPVHLTAAPLPATNT